jgi:hypothetical protein
MRLLPLFLFFTSLFSESVDLVMPVHEKDAPYLDVIIDAAEEYIEDLGNIYIISRERFTDRAIWIDEKLYPFSIDDIGVEIGQLGGIGNHSRCGWYYQQLLKLYVFRVIRELSDYVLILDADTKPCHKMKFVNNGRVYMDRLNLRCDIDKYYSHMKRVLPRLHTVNKKVNPVVHHALLCRDIVTSMLEQSEHRGKKPFWKCFLNAVDTSKTRKNKDFYVGASEYMMYYHYCMNYYKHRMIERVVTQKDRCRNFVEYRDDPSCEFVSSHKYIK